MEEKLSVIKIGSLQRRMKREFEILIKENICDEQDIQIKEKIDNLCSNVKDYIIDFKYSKDNKFYNFQITNNYPFKPPKIKINNCSTNFAYPFHSHFRCALKKYAGIECFCCESILCSNNWSPQFTIKDIINDINIFRSAIRQVIDHIIVDVIKRKYLIDDINIIEWLY